VPEDAVFSFVMVDRFADGAPNAADVVVGHPRRFQGGDLVGLRERLPALAALGVTHVWITPVAAQVEGLVGVGDGATAAYHGYWPQDLGGVDRHFGTAADLQGVLAAARTHGIGVVLDVVVNHLGYGTADPDRIVRPICGDDDVTGCLFGLPDLATEDPRVRAIVVERTAAWARDHPFAGFRLDALKHVDRSLARDVGRAARVFRPGFFTVAEHWGAAPGDPVVAAIVADGAADAVLDFSLSGLARDWVTGRMRSAALAHHLVRRDRALREGPPMLAFLDNHDVETWAHAVGAARAPLGAPFLLFDRAVPVITWGTEVGRRGGAGDPENRTFMPWDDLARAESDAGSALHLWRGLVRLRRSYEVVRRGELTVVAHDAVDAAADGFLVLQRRAPGRCAVVAVARGKGLVHVQDVERGARVLDVVAASGGAAAVDGARLTVRVPADGVVAVVLQTGGPP
jgi:glycosidase